MRVECSNECPEYGRQDKPEQGNAIFNIVCYKCLIDRAMAKEKDFDYKDIPPNPFGKDAYYIV